jgi:hypothetical protein
MHKKILITLRTYNDIDNIVPAIWSLLENGHCIFVFGISDYDYENDYRIKFLKEYPNMNLYLCKRHNAVLQILKYNVFSMMFFSIYKKIDIFISEWWRPTYRGVKGQIFLATKLLNIKKIALPHGYNVFLNDDVSISVASKLKCNPKIYSDRNEFDYYTFATDIQRDQAIRLGIDKNIARSIGSARFSYKWHEILTSIENKPARKYTDKIGICFMTPHWSYNVNKKDTIAMIRAISKLENVVLYIKPHTRGSGNLDEMSKYGDSSNIKYIEDQTSFELIYKTDITIAFGTSIIFESILQNKYIINPKYLHTNKTIFDAKESIYQATNINEVLEYICLIQKGKPLINKNEYKAIIKESIYNGLDEEPIDNYNNLILGRE